MEPSHVSGIFSWRGAEIMGEGWHHHHHQPCPSLFCGGRVARFFKTSDVVLHCGQIWTSLLLYYFYRMWIHMCWWDTVYFADSGLKRVMRIWFQKDCVVLMTWHGFDGKSVEWLKMNCCKNSSIMIWEVLELNLKCLRIPVKLHRYFSCCRIRYMWREYLRNLTLDLGPCPLTSASRGLLLHSWVYFAYIGYSLYPFLEAFFNWKISFLFFLSCNKGGGGNWLGTDLLGTCYVKIYHQFKKNDKSR